MHFYDPKSIQTMLGYKYDNESKKQFFLNISGLQKYELGTALILLHDKLKMEDPKKHEELGDNLVQEIRQNLQDTIDVILPYESPDNQLCLVARNAEAELSQFNHSIVDSCSSFWIEWPDYFKHSIICRKIWGKKKNNKFPFFSQMTGILFLL